MGNALVGRRHTPCYGPLDQARPQPQAEEPAEGPRLALVVYGALLRVRR